MAERSQRARPRLDENALFEYAVEALAARAHSSAELRRKLRARAERAGDVARVVARLKECGYLSDRRFAETLASARLHNQGFGKTRVLRELRERRVAPAVAEKAVREAYAEVDETVLIEQYVERRILRAGRGGRLRDEKELASAYRKLLRAGFSHSNALRVLKRFAATPGQFDEFDPPEPEEAGEGTPGA